MTNKELSQKLLVIWTKAGPEVLAAHCGGMGLVCGCPVCGRIFGNFKLPRSK